MLRKMKEMNNLEQISFHQNQNAALKRLNDIDDGKLKACVMKLLNRFKIKI